MFSKNEHSISFNTLRSYLKITNILQSPNVECVIYLNSLEKRASKDLNMTILPLRFTQSDQLDNNMMEFIALQTRYNQISPNKRESRIEKEVVSTRFRQY